MYMINMNMINMNSMNSINHKICKNYKKQLDKCMKNHNPKKNLLCVYYAYMVKMYKCDHSCRFK